MPQERNKGQAGMGGRGKNEERGRNDVGTRRRKRNTGESATLTKPAKTPRGNQGRNQREWNAERRMKSRYAIKEGARASPPAASHEKQALQ